MLLISEAGAIGTTVCPGCEVMLCIGTTPWNSSTLEQAHGRIYRIGQNKPVEIVQLVPRRGVTDAKLALHADKRERLARAAKDLDYSAFEESDKQKWRNQCAILDSLRPLDALGNFAVAEAERAAAAAWAHAPSGRTPAAASGPRRRATCPRRPSARGACPCRARARDICLRGKKVFFKAVHPVTTCSKCKTAVGEFVAHLALLTLGAFKNGHDSWSCGMLDAHLALLVLVALVVCHIAVGVLFAHQALLAPCTLIVQHRIH